MKSLCGFFMILFFCGSALAHEAFLLKSAKQERSFYLIGAMGLESRQENTAQNYLENRSLPSFLLGLRHNSWRLYIDYAEMSTETGAGALSVKRTWYNHLIWLDWEASMNSWLNSTFGAGFGRSRTSVEQIVFGAKTVDDSAFQTVAGVTAGLLVRIPQFPYIWGEISGRVMTSESWDPSPFLSLAARVGVQF